MTTNRAAITINGPTIYGYCAALGIIFVTLRLTGVIAWSWLWVLAPFWIPVVVLLSLVGLTVLAWVIADAEMKRRKRQRNKFLIDRNTKRAGR